MPRLEPRRAPPPAWLPVRVWPEDSEDPPGGRVEWLDFTGTTLAEPFFHQSVARLRRDAPHLTPYTSPLAALGDVAEEIAPSGFIFHISRCGSTLLANALRGAPGCVVVSEAQPVSALLGSAEPSINGTRGCERHSEHARRSYSRARTAALEPAPVIRGARGEAALGPAPVMGAMRAYGRRRDGSERYLIFKFTSWNVLRLAWLRQLWPETPCVTVIRDPAEVVVSCLRNPPGWLRLQPAVAAAVFGWPEAEIRAMSRERYCARAVGAFLEAMAAGLDARCRVMDYRQLDPARATAVVAFFGIPPERMDPGALAACFRVYAKDQDRAQPFTSDREDKQAAITASIRRECDRWAAPAYARLQGECRW